MYENIKNIFKAAFLRGEISKAQKRKSSKYNWVNRITLSISLYVVGYFCSISISKHTKKILQLTQINKLSIKITIGKKDCYNQKTTS